MKEVVSNAFSLQMIQGDCTIKIMEVDQLPPFYKEEIFPFNDEGGIPCNFDDCGTPQSEVRTVETGIISAIGHPDTAKVLGIPCNRINIRLEKQDVLYVAQLQGGRLPEGATTLPEGFSFKYFKIEIV